ncbi:MAG: multicopper oxidase domain-containing protein [Methanotrichaceae archaeon]|nr:multicopper oxidase domain-containing protein [Methanotrichaceae archaeon]
MQDDFEKDMIDGTNLTGVNPTGARVIPGIEIPLIIQDKSFVDNTTIAFQDPTWNWGTGPKDVTGKITKAITGDLWYPHVYMPNQNPADLVGGANAFGRWDFGPFMMPGLPVEFPPIQNPYLPGGPLEYQLIPAIPNASTPMEAFMDTAMVNGAVYPNLNVEPKAYRFRILNAANDRFFNLQLYKATGIVSNLTLTGGGSGYNCTPSVSITNGGGTGATASATIDPVSGKVIVVNLLTVGSGYTTVPTVTITGGGGAGATATAKIYTKPTEVGMVPAPDGRDGGVPDPTTSGPSFIQIGNEGGFLPAPVVLPNRPVGWNNDQSSADYGIVNQGTLQLACAERADVIVDFSQYAGKTLILYNDAPAAFPAPDPRYDYYTGHPDLTDTGGAPKTQPGYGPNTRTIMQIKVLSAPVGPDYMTTTLQTLQNVFANTSSKKGVFSSSQDEVIVPQSNYNSAYNKNFPDQYVNSSDTSKTFQTVSGASATVKIEGKAILDDLMMTSATTAVGTYDTEYGRMNAVLGLQIPVAPGFAIYPYPSPPVEIIKNSVYGTPIGSLGDGTQIWNFRHYGVDSHPIHVHLFDVQIINRVAGTTIRPPDANELGWKETFKVNPLQDAIVAFRPTAPALPFEVPNSTRLLDPTLPLGQTMRVNATPPWGGFKDPSGAPVTIVNHLVNFGWEYVYHCHILDHEEFDMMHGMSFVVPPVAPSNLTAAIDGSVTLNWKDNSISETGFNIQRARDASFTTDLTNFTVGQNVTTYIDNTFVPSTRYYYRVQASNIVGDTTNYAPAVGFPKMSANSTFSNMVKIPIGIGVFRSGSWYLDANGDRIWGPGDLTGQFGLAGDQPVAGDWNGDGKDKIGVLRGGTSWFLDANGDRTWGPGDLTGTFGVPLDLQVAGDWNGDGKDEIGVLRGGTSWYLDYNGNRIWGPGDLTGTFGISGDRPVSGDWNGDGKDEIGVLRGGTSWYLDYNGDRIWGPGDLTATFGLSGDQPVAGYWV